MIAGEYHQQLYSQTPIEEYIADNLVGGKPNGRIKDFSKHSLNIEYELKIKNIPSSLYTKKARRLARHRISIMATFFANLEKELTVSE